ncbi:hypothetical protein B0H14DRAFT_2559271 [Mycena olivaceomarginata]|nr:hypothetical protein B0H14DRAFT_2559271 [Mycena olivaceomarginata]
MVRITETAHTICVCVTVWEYVGQHLTNPEKLQEIVPCNEKRMNGYGQIIFCTDFVPRDSPVLIEELFQATIILTLIAMLNVNLFGHPASEAASVLACCCLERGRQTQFGAGDLDEDWDEDWEDDWEHWFHYAGPNMEAPKRITLGRAREPKSTPAIIEWPMLETNTTHGVWCSVHTARIFGVRSFVRRKGLMWPFGFPDFLGWGEDRNPHTQCGLTDCRERGKIENEGLNIHCQYVIFNGTLHEVESANSTLSKYRGTKNNIPTSLCCGL